MSPVIYPGLQVRSDIVPVRARGQLIPGGSAGRLSRSLCVWRQAGAEEGALASSYSLWCGCFSGNYRMLPSRETTVIHMTDYLKERGGKGEVAG